MNDTKTNQERVEKLAEHIARQVYDLSLDYLPKIEKAGSESEKGEAKVSFAIAWPAYHHSPSVVTKLSFSSSTKDETESRIDLEQQGFNFGNDEEEDSEPKEAQKPEAKQLPYDADAVIDGEEVPDFVESVETTTETWYDAGKGLPDADIVVKIKTDEGLEYTGEIMTNEDWKEEVFNSREGGLIPLNAIALWRDLTDEEIKAREAAAEEATVEDFQDDPDEDTDIHEDYVFTRYASTNHGRDESGKLTASSTAGEQQAAAAVIAKLHPDSELLRLDEAKHMPKRVFKGEVEWNVWSYAVRLNEAGEFVEVTED